MEPNIIDPNAWHNFVCLGAVRIDEAIIAPDGYTTFTFFSGNKAGKTVYHFLGRDEFFRWLDDQGINREKLAHVEAAPECNTKVVCEEPGQ